MDLWRYLAVLRRRALLILLAAVVAGAYAAINTDRTVTYTASSTLYVGADSFTTDGGDPNLSGDENAGISQLIRTFATMIDTPTIASDAIEISGVPRSAFGVAEATQAAQVPGTNILQVSVTDVDPSIAQSLANGLAEGFIARISELEPGETAREGDIPNAPARIFERASYPTAAQAPSVLSKVLAAAALAALLACGAVVALEYLDVTVKSAADAESKLELPVLCVVPVLRLDPGSSPRNPPDEADRLGLVRDA